eukprot:TRINITY_DN23123_c0_g1_i1.p1 TRINITY_DN23123_c0_g1~~TRINITY_DN23123_c0_g1_i1.p1  ORF type:complete len:565 (+),score=163.76 TRINITY_DN23123_c0_g1_i1:205-1899(+)
MCEEEKRLRRSRSQSNILLGQIAVKDRHRDRERWEYKDVFPEECAPRKTWSGIYDIPEDVEILYPETKAEFCEMVRESSLEGKGIRVMGSRYNFVNTLAPAGIPKRGRKKSGAMYPLSEEKIPFDEDMQRFWQHDRPYVLISTEKLNKIISVDKDAKTITVQAGVKISALFKELDKYGLVLPVLGNVRGQTCGGVVATGVHGRTTKLGCISTCVESMSLITCEGMVRLIDVKAAFTEPPPTETPKKDSFSEHELACAAGVSIGLLGAICEITFKAEDSVGARYTSENVDWDFDEFKKRWNDALENDQYVAFYYFPVAEMAQYTIANQEQSEPEPDPTEKLMRFNVVSNLFVQLYVWGVRATGKLIPRAAWGELQAAVVKANSPQEIDGAKVIDVISVNDGGYQHFEMDVAVPAELCPEIIRRAKMKFDELGKFPTLAIDIRVSGADPFYLSGGYGRKTAWIDFLIPHQGTDELDWYYDEMLSICSAVCKENRKELAGKGGPRLHWGKCRAGVYFDENGAKKFEKVRKLMDPQGVFRSSYLDHISTSKEGRRSLTRRDSSQCSLS